MAIVSQTPSISEVKQVLAETSNSVGGLCTSPKINKWAKYKPVRHPSKGDLTESELQSVHYGLSVSYDGTADYTKPIGGEQSPFRLGDFRGYNRNARPPVSVEIISVGNQTQPPYRVRRNSQATITFKLIPGDIEPQYLRDNCYREKNTNPSGGYGGLSWIGETTDSTSLLVERQPNEVFGTEILEVEHSQLVRFNNRPRLEYMRYKGDAWGTYESIRNWVEDRSYLNYFELFGTSDVVSFVQATLMYDPNIDRVTARLRILNDSTSTIRNIRVRARYTINAPAMPTPGDYENLFVEGSPFDLPVSLSYTTLNLSYYKQGEINTYTCYFYIEERVGNDWVEVGSIQIFNEDIYIPIPN